MGLSAAAGPYCVFFTWTYFWMLIEMQIPAEANKTSTKPITSLRTLKSSGGGRLGGRLGSGRLGGRLGSGDGGIIGPEPGSPEPELFSPEPELYSSSQIP